jgi:hypothetical protein
LALPSKNRRDTHTDRWQGFMECAIEKGSDAMIFIPCFIKIGSGIKKTHSMEIA